MAGVGGSDGGKMETTVCEQQFKKWMELESIMLSEISQVVRDKYHMISPLTEP